MSKITKVDLKNSVKKCIKTIDPNVTTLRIFCKIVEKDLNIKEHYIFNNRKIKHTFRNYTLKYLDIDTSDDIGDLMNNMVLE